MRYSHHICGRYQRAIEILGKRWTGLILKVLTAGPLRFNEIAEQIEVISDRVLSERLKELERETIVVRHVYAETPVRIEYALTEKGEAIIPTLVALQEWAEAWLEPAPELLADSE